MTPIEKLKEDMIELIESKIGSKASGTTVNFHSPEGGGKSSCQIEKQKDGAKVTVKAYSDDLDPLAQTCTILLEQYKRILKEANEGVADYKKAYDILMAHFDDIPEGEEREKVHKALEELGL